VTNARAYAQSLRKRGMISLYVADGDLKAQCINAKVRTPGVSGPEASPRCPLKSHSLARASHTDAVLPSERHFTDR
jgi:hypothetical protein